MPVDSAIQAGEPEVQEDVVAVHGPFALTTTAAVPTREPTLEEWEDAVAWCQRVEKASPFWIGDLLAYGEHKFGEMYTQAMDATHYSYGTLANMVYVARHVHSSRRREHLRFAHHQEVAQLPDAEQDIWLNTAEVEALTTQQLRHRIKAAKAESTGQSVEWVVVVRCADEADQRQLAERLRLEGRTVRLAVQKP